MQDGFPFTVREADVRLFTVDRHGNPLQEQWIGGEADRVGMDSEYKERAVQYAGRPFARTYHEDESHKVTVSNVRLIDTAGSPPSPMLLRRNVEYALVIVWWDPEASLWLKRCYFGVKAQPGNVAEDNIFQTLRFTAESMADLAGTGAKPGFDLIRIGEVIYVDGSERTPLYTYDPGTRQFYPINEHMLAGRASIDTSVSGQITIKIGDTIALLANAAALHLPPITAIGGSFLDDDPRLEFWSGPYRCASLSATNFAAPNIIETATQPTGAVEVDGFNPAWLFTIGQSATVAPAFTEISE